eukprot:TRINITY_DN12915_c1_g1_i3.p1 TRINITY_DN12915_c1_g1~~TRINITY_DN12915_c1_g1_i3.p1  ORF type:complete len:220 (+),score=-9.91 TRINITY_DN12915_c1_g1_i3:396-1055(+)
MNCITIKKYKKSIGSKDLTPYDQEMGKLLLLHQLLRLFCFIQYVHLISFMILNKFQRIKRDWIGLFGINIVLRCYEQRLVIRKSNFVLHVYACQIGRVRCSYLSIFCQPSWQCMYMYICMHYRSGLLLSLTCNLLSQIVLMCVYMRNSSESNFLTKSIVSKENLLEKYIMYHYKQYRIVKYPLYQLVLTVAKQGVDFVVKKRIRRRRRFRFLTNFQNRA